MGNFKGKKHFLEFEFITERATTEFPQDEIIKDICKAFEELKKKGKYEGVIMGMHVYPSEQEG